MNTFTAHIRTIKENVERQTVWEHSSGTAERAETYVERMGVSVIARLQGMLHDAGKLCEDFNRYILGENEFRRGEIDHCYAGAKYLMQIAEQTREKEMIETARFISHTLISHHGLHDWIDECGQDYFRKRIAKEERYEEIHQNLLRMLPEQEWLDLLYAAKEEYLEIKKKIFSAAKQGSQNQQETKIQTAFYMGQFERFMQSVLVDADRTDTADFQMNKATEEVFEEHIWEQFAENVEKKCREFAKKTDFISRLRCDISDRCRHYAEQERGICRLIVPTGGGKTISSLRFAVHYCKKHKKERIFYIAPFRTILEQNCEEWKQILGAEYVLEHHSDMIASFETGEEVAEYELRSDKWDLPVIMTTMVQFMNTFFSGRMDSVRRMHRLCNSVMIIDEIQSLPAECTFLFNLQMNFLSAVGKSVIVLCSATQPVLEKLQYPLQIPDYESSMTGDYTEDFQAFKRTELISALRKTQYTYKEAAEFCLEKYRTNGNVLFVVNTKAAAFEIYQELCKQKDADMRIAHLSTHMCPEHRKTLIQDLKETVKNEKVICVTTQMIEAGVDISFPCVIRSLAGMDNAAQAAGRCNRNGEYGSSCKVYLVNLCEEKLGSLKAIKTAQAASNCVLSSKAVRDLLSPETMELYFERYYEERCRDLSYNVKDDGKKTDLLDLLSLNQRWNSNSKKGSYRVQAFQTAGKLFQMIDAPDVSVVVPYNEEAKELIAQLWAGANDYELILLMRKLQKYTVGLYEQVRRKLQSEEAVKLLPCGVWVLEEGYYDHESGIVMKGKPMELLMF